MLLLNEARMTPVAGVKLGNLVLYHAEGSGSGFCVALRVELKSTKSEPGLIVFGLVRDGQKLPAQVFRKSVGQHMGITLGPALATVEAPLLLSGLHHSAVAAGSLIPHSAGWGIAAHDDQMPSSVSVWDLKSGLLIDGPGVVDQLLGWTIGVAGIDGKFVPLVVDQQAPLRAPA